MVLMILIRRSPRWTPLQRTAHSPPENVDDVLHLAYPQKKRCAEKCRCTECNGREQDGQLFEKAHVRPRIQPQVISRPAHQRQQRAGETNFYETVQRLECLQPARVLSHKLVETELIHCL